METYFYQFLKQKRAERNKKRRDKHKAKRLQKPTADPPFSDEENIHGY